MKGYVKIISSQRNFDVLLGEVITKYRINIQYDDLQLIETSIIIRKENASFTDLMETAKKYFQGELVF